MKKKIALVITSLFVYLLSFSQVPGYISEGALLDGKSIVKADITGIAFNSFGFSGERILNKNFSVALGLNLMPSGTFPFANAILTGSSNNDPNMMHTLNSLRINSFSFTPEFRIYLSNTGYGKGFYLAPYYRYNGLQMGFNLKESSADIHVDMKGKIKTHSGGLLLGVQWLLGTNKNIVIDWNILGVHGGSIYANLTGVADKEVLDSKQQAEMKKELDEKLNAIPLIRYTSTVQGNSVSVYMKGPWLFFRGSISVGFRF